VARNTLITLALLGTALTLHGMQQPSDPHDTDVELGEPTNPIDLVGSGTDLIQRQVGCRQEATAIVTWLQKERPGELSTLCQSNMDDPALATRVLRHIVAYKHTQCLNMAQWRTILAVYGGIATVGIVALTALLIKIGTSC